MSLGFFSFYFLCAQHVSDIDISIIRSLRLCCWITTSVVLFSVRCVLEIWCGWFWVVFVLQTEASACKTSTTQNQPHQISNTQRTENKTIDVVIQQHSRKLLMMDILMSETCWAHKTWNKIASDIKLLFHSSTLLLMLIIQTQYHYVLTGLRDIGCSVLIAKFLFVQYSSASRWCPVRPIISKPLSFQTLSVNIFPLQVKDEGSIRKLASRLIRERKLPDYKS